MGKMVSLAGTNNNDDLQHQLPIHAPKYWGFIIATSLLVLCYAIQLASPLRLGPDQVSLLELASKLTDGLPYLQDGVRPIYPIGVPWVFSAMERAGVANAFGFALLNFCCLCVAGFATWVISGGLGMSSKRRWAGMLLGFSSYVLFKHSVSPLTDIPYMAVSLGGIAFMELAVDQSGWRRIIACFFAILCVASGILTRRVGVAMLPAMLYTVWLSLNIRKSLKRPAKLNAGVVITSGVLLTVLILFALQLRLLLYIPDFHFGEIGVQGVIRQIIFRLTDFGELFLNTSAAKLGPFHMIVFPAGMSLLVLLCGGLWQARRRMRPTHVYLLVYIAIFAIWPFADSRFWIPVLPLLAIVAIEAGAPWLDVKWVRILVKGYLVSYGFLAIIAFAYTTRISYSGNRFEELYGSDETRAAYEQARSGRVTPANATFVQSLRRYGQNKQGQPPIPSR